MCIRDRLNIILEFFGFDTIAILAEEDYVTYGIIAAGLWPQTAYCMILYLTCLLYTSPSPRDATLSRMPSSA